MARYATATVNMSDREAGVATAWYSPAPRFRSFETATTTPSQSKKISIYIQGAALLPKWFELARDGLTAILALPANWNSYAAREIEITAVTGAVELLLAVMSDTTPLPTFVPLANGGVLLEWHTLAADLEATALPNGRAQIVFEAVDEEPVEIEGLPQEVTGQLKAFLQRI